MLLPRVVGTIVREKAIAHRVGNFRVRFSSQSSASTFGGSEFLTENIKILAMDAKMQKIEPDPNFFFTDESFGGSV